MDDITDSEKYAFQEDAVKKKVREVIELVLSHEEYDEEAGPSVDRLHLRSVRGGAPCGQEAVQVHRDVHHTAEDGQCHPLVAQRPTGTE